MASFEAILAAEAPITTRPPSDVWTAARGRHRWLYMRLTDESLLWGDKTARGAAASRIRQMFSDLAAVGGREVHLLTLRWNEEPALPDDLAPRHRTLLDPVMASFSKLAGFCAVGVKLTLPGTGAAALRSR